MLRKSALLLLTLVGALLALMPAGHAQDVSLPATNMRSRAVAVGKGDTLRLDTLSIHAASLRVAGVADSDYVFIPGKSLIAWKHKPRQDSITVRYRVLPVAFDQPRFHKDLRIQDSLFEDYTYRNIGPRVGQGSGAFVDEGALEYNGSIGRAIALGNNQDVTLNSTFNLQAAGYLLDSIRLEAAITDNNVPFQPEGNTQRIQEFDQIFITLTKGYHALQIGDYNLERPRGYFLNYFKRVQGIQFQSRFGLGRPDSWNAYGVSFSVAKGQFARNIFQGQEGNQGPYKLQGNNNEQFFLVLPATERVFINGVLQERGDQADYIINYNTAEVRFMPRRLITKDSRIQIEFEYQDRSYLNSLATGYDDAQIGKRLNLRTNVYANQDAKNQNYTQSLTGPQKIFLSGIGDSIGHAFYPVIGTDTFSAGKILYKMVDTAVNGALYDSVFVYSTNPDSAFYSLSFSFVGAGRGDYNISAGNANGRVYEWVAPVGNLRQGSYAPVQLLVTPKAHQVVTLAATYAVNDFSSVFVEGAFSNYNPNTFSTRDNQSHGGAALKARYNEVRTLGRRDSTGRPRHTWASEASYERVDARFRAVAPFRNVEFGRDWNVPQPTFQTDARPTENLGGYTGKLTHANLGALGYNFTVYQREGGYLGNRHAVSYLYNKPRHNTGFVLNLTSTKDTALQGRYFRPTAFAEYQLWRKAGPLLGARYDLERNELHDLRGDSLSRYAFAFDIATAYLRTPVADQQAVHYNLNFTRRRDWTPRAGELRQRDFSHTVDVNAGFSRWNQTVSLTGSYRKLYLVDTTYPGYKPEETLLGRLEHTGALLKGAVTLSALYELGTGQEQKRQYTYQEVPVGQGLFTWNDYNGDGVQQANEFEVALYQDQKRFIRILSLTNEYVRVNYVTYNQSITLDPASLWRNTTVKGLRKFVARFSDQASLQISNRLLADEGIAAYNPFRAGLRDDNVILTSNIFNNTLFFNRNSTRYGFDYNVLVSSTKQLLTYGVEGSGLTQHLPRLRLAVGKSFTTFLGARLGRRQYQSALDDGRSYDIGNRGLEPQINYLYRAVFRATASGRLEDRENAAQFGGQRATVRSASLELRYTQPTAGALTARGTFTGIEYTGATGTAVSFTILEALQPGANYLWYLNWERRVGKGIELLVEYEGRQAGKTPVIHTGRMSLRAIL